MNVDGKDTHEFKRARYSALITLWTHHNQTQLQWPTVIVGAALLVISTIALANISDMLDPTLWGAHLDKIFAIGVALLFTGLAILTMVYTMARARRIMLDLEQEIDDIEKELGNIQRSFGRLNHPNPKRLSGPKLMRDFMTYLLALPLTLFGLLLVLGPIWGIVAEIGLISLCIIVWFRSLEPNNSAHTSAEIKDTSQDHDVLAAGSSTVDYKPAQDSNRASLKRE